MNHIEIPEIGFSADVPESYAEMSRPQVLYIMKQLYKLQSGKITLTEFRIRVLYKLVGIRRKRSSIIWERLHPEEARERTEKIVLLTEQLLGFIFKINDGQAMPTFDTIENHLPILRIGPCRLFGPCVGLQDLSFGELRTAHAHMMLYAATRDEIHLNYMIACLYRSHGSMQPAGRRIKAMTHAEVERCVRLIRYAPAWKKQMILLWYAANVEHLQTGTYTIEGEPICFASLFANEGHRGESLGWLAVAFDLAEKGTFGDIEKTDAVSIIDILTLLYHYKIQSDDARKARQTD